MLESVFILRWSGWRKFALDFLVIQIGFFLFATSINIVVQANLGTGPWIVLEKGLADRLSISLGQASIAVAGVIVLTDVLRAHWALGDPLWFGTLIFAITIGPVVQLAFQVLKIRAR